MTKPDKAIFYSNTKAAAIAAAASTGLAPSKVEEAVAGTPMSESQTVA